MRTINSIFYALALVTLLGSCRSERDQIVFPDSAKEIESGLLQMNNLLNKLPVTDVNNYFFDQQGELYINNRSIGLTETITLEAVKEFKNFTASEKKEFLRLALFLKENKIAGSYLNNSFDTWMYSYDLQEDNSYVKNRTLFYQDSQTPLQGIKQAYEILDTAGSLVLIKGKENN